MLYRNKGQLVGVCAMCGAEFSRWESERGKFCGLGCYRAWQKKTGHTNLKQHVPDEQMLPYLLSKCSTNDVTGCLEFNAFRNKAGYGQMQFRRKLWLVHRIAWTLQRGEIPDGLFVCHRCDNPPCCNVEHLFLGTCADNTHDSMEKGRNSPPPHRVGSDNNMSKFTEDDIREIRALIMSGYGNKEISEKFNVDTSAIRYIRVGKVWGWFEPEWFDGASMFISPGKDVKPGVVALATPRSFRKRVVKKHIKTWGVPRKKRNPDPVHVDESESPNIRRSE